MERQLTEILRVIGESRTILVATHIFPDADALGSQLALGEILTSLGKKICLYSEEPVSHILDFLPGSDQLQTSLPDLRGFDCAITLDCGDKYRLGKEVDALMTVHPFIVLDHHAGHKEFGDLSWVEAHRAATAEMVFDLAQALGVELSLNAAYCLYAAIVADSGSFNYSSTTADTFRIAGELVARGVSPSDVAGRLFDNFTRNRLQLLQFVLNTLELYADERIAMIHVSRAMFDQTGTSGEDTELFINYPRSLSTVKVAVFIKETKTGLIGVSLRSKGDCDVARIAVGFGGGGHRNAAGFKMADTGIDEVREMLLQELVAVV